MASTIIMLKLHCFHRIQNFMYTMVKFDLISCTVMVCVTDAKCMDLCRQAGFPCFDFRYDTFHPVASLA